MKNDAADKRNMAGDEKPVGRTPTKPRQRKSTVAKEVISGDFLTNEKLRKWYPLILWICVLIFIYIGVQFNFQRLQRVEIQQRMMLNEERSRAVIFSSMRMNASRHSRIIDEVKQRGLPLEESTLPPKIVEKGKKN